MSVAMCRVPTGQSNHRYHQQWFVGVRQPTVRVSLSQCHSFLFCLYLASEATQARVIIIDHIYKAHITLSPYALGIITPALAELSRRRSNIIRNTFLLGTHLLHLGRERQLWIKCLALDLSRGIRTERDSNHQPFGYNTRQEYEPLDHSAPT